METSRLAFKSVIIENEAIVMPMAKEPELPTKILPLTLKMARTSQKIKGPNIIVKYGCPSSSDVPKSPMRIMAGHTVSNPFNPPSWFTALVTTITINGIITK